MKRILLIAATIVLFINNSYGQGCSDAGFCTLENFKPMDGEDEMARVSQIKFGLFYGGADNSISVYGNYLEYNRQLSDNFSIDTKITTIGQNGNDISEFGLSDVFINANYKTKSKLKFTLGAKIPLSKANKTKDNLVLPMDYQASLGTYDLIFGVGYELNKFQFALAMQQPLSQNDNKFKASDYPGNSNLASFQTTNNFERAGDVLLRVSYPFNLGSKLKLTPSILPIYHLANDKYTDAFDQVQEIIGSKGLTLNGNIYLDYNLTDRSIIQLNIGVPFMVRDARPDGLTRSFVANLEYKIRF